MSSRSVLSTLQAHSTIFWCTRYSRDTTNFPSLCSIDVTCIVLVSQRRKRIPGAGPSRASSVGSSMCCSVTRDPALTTLRRWAAA